MPLLDASRHPHRWLVTVGLLLAGTLQAWSIAWPWGGQTVWWLQWLALAAGVRLLTLGVAQTATPRQRWRTGWWRGWLLALAWLAGSFWWLYISMHVYGGMPGWLAALSVLALAGALALFYAFACGFWLRWRGAQGSGVRSSLLFATLWTLAELCRGEWFTGFPWGAVGYAHADGPLAGLAPWLGVYGMGFVAVWLAAMLGQAVLPAGQLQRSGWQRRVFWLAAGAFLPALLLHWVNPRLTRPAGSQPLSVELLQGNIPQNEKFQPNGGVQVALRWYGEQLLESHAELVVVPETALPALPQYLPEGYWAALQQRFATGQQAALLGIPAGNRDIGYANAVVGMVPGGARSTGGSQSNLALPPSSSPEYTYAKHHLVPFGEFIPYGFKWFVDMMRMPLGDFQRGATTQPRLLWQGQRIQPNICYEDLFGEELASAFTDADQAPTVLVNLSNIAWFGDTVAIDQHRHISRLRAMELGRPMLRATNTGATAIIDYRGQVLHELPRLQRAVLSGVVQGRNGITPYAWWTARFGLAPLWLLLLALLTVQVRIGAFRSDRLRLQPDLHQ